MIYFKTYAKKHGCDCLDKGDLAIWRWIQAYQKITVWEIYENGTWKHNHTSRGYDAEATAPTPNPKYPNQAKAWKGQTWRGIESRMTCYNVVKEPLEEYV